MILVTGASGYLGSHIVKQLVEAGKSVRALARSRARAEAEGRLAGFKIEWAEGDVTKPESLAEAITGVEAVVHTVAVAIEKGPGAYEAINYQGTVNVVNAAKAAGVKRFVNTCQLAVCRREVSEHGLRYSSQRVQAFRWPVGSSQWGISGVRRLLFLIIGALKHPLR